MKEIFKNSISLFGRIVTINIMCFFLVISLSVLITAAFSENIGYVAMGTSSENEQSVELYRHYYEDGEDTKRAEYEENGYTVSESKIRSEVSKTGNTLFLCVTAVFCTILLISFIYPKFWQMGTKDSNLVHFKHKKEDKLKGLKCGLIAIVPSLILLTVFKFLLPEMQTALYKFLNCGTYNFVELIIGKNATFGDINILQFLGLALLNAIVPLTAYTAYLLGYKNISLGEKFIYKKNKEN